MCYVDVRILWGSVTIVLFSGNNMWLCLEYVFVYVRFWLVCVFCEEVQEFGRVYVLV